MKNSKYFWLLMILMMLPLVGCFGQIDTYLVIKDRSNDIIDLQLVFKIVNWVPSGEEKTDNSEKNNDLNDLVENIKKLGASNVRVSSSIEKVETLTQQELTVDFSLKKGKELPLILGDIKQDNSEDNILGLPVIVYKDNNLVVKFPAADIKSESDERNGPAVDAAMVKSIIEPMFCMYFIYTEKNKPKSVSLNYIKDKQKISKKIGVKKIGDNYMIMFPSLGYISSIQTNFDLVFSW